MPPSIALIRAAKRPPTLPYINFDQSFDASDIAAQVTALSNELSLPSIPSHRLLYALERIQPFITDLEICAPVRDLVLKIESKFCTKWHAEWDVKQNLKLVRGLRRCRDKIEEVRGTIENSNQPVSLLFARSLSSRLHRLSPTEFVVTAEEISSFTGIPIVEKRLLLADVARELVGEGFLVGSLSVQELLNMAESYSVCFDEIGSGQ